MADYHYQFQTKLWLWTTEKGGWTFLTLPKATADEIKFLSEMSGQPRQGWGSVKVTATIGNSTWSTSIFPHKAEQSYLMPVKAAVRKKEGVNPPDEVNVSLLIKFTDLPF